MGKDTPNITSGPKTFFVTPDLSVVTEDFLQTAFFHGFETYVINDDPYLSIEDKVIILAKRFPAHIFFFSIYKGGNLPFWIGLITRLQRSLGEHFRAGVLYKDTNGEAFNTKLKRLFLLGIGISSGCIPMTLSIPKNQTMLIRVLLANQAEGRRKHVRLVCSPKFTFNLTYKGVDLQGELRDLSVSHFSCSFSHSDPQIESRVLIRKIQLRLAGILCTVDAVVALKREMDGNTMYAFTFRNSNNQDGLDELMLGKINKLICDHFVSSMKKELSVLFQHAIVEKRIKAKEQAPPPSIAPAQGSR